MRAYFILKKLCFFFFFFPSLVARGLGGTGGKGKGSGAQEFVGCIPWFRFPVVLFCVVLMCG